MKYYVRLRGYVGNCLLWWRKSGNGYTCNLDDAEVFDGDDKQFHSIVKDRSTYTAWEQAYIDSCAHRHADSEHIDMAKAGIAKGGPQ